MLSTFSPLLHESLLQTLWAGHIANGGHAEDDDAGRYIAEQPTDLC